jgi:hypothetical protein
MIVSQVYCAIQPNSSSASDSPFEHLRVCGLLHANMEANEVQLNVLPVDFPRLFGLLGAMPSVTHSLTHPLSCMSAPRHV